MLKFRKRNVYGECFNDVAEYIGSTVFRLLGVEAQHCFLGLFQGEKVVACKDFSQDFFFIPFKEVGESSIDDEKFKYKYRYFDIEQLINKNHKIIDHEAAISSFWKMYVIDALLANSDRHGSNWGFLKNKHQYLMAPVFDNGSCLFSNFSSVDEMNEVLADASLFNEYIIYFRSP